MLRSFATNSAFHKIETPLPLLAITTDFERGFHAEDIATLHAAYTRVR
jgi:hypothetical protein